MTHWSCRLLCIWLSISVAQHSTSDSYICSRSTKKSLWEHNTTLSKVFWVIFTAKYKSSFGLSVVQMDNRWKEHGELLWCGVWFTIPLNTCINTLQVILAMVFPTYHLTGAKTQSFQPIAWLVLATKCNCNQRYNTKNIIKQLLTYAQELNSIKPKPG